MQPDRAKPRAPKLASGLFGAAPPPANDSVAKPARKEPEDRTALNLKHLFGRDG